MSRSKKDYYEILGVARTATAKEIKAAYRRLARKFHPDVNKDDKSAEERFKRVAEAFAVLSDKEKRNRYDHGGHEAFGQGFNPFAGADRSQFDFGGADLSDLLNSMFGGFAGGGARARRGTRRARRGDDLRLEVKVPFEEAVKGTTAEFVIPRLVSCGECSGSGTGAGGAAKACPDCGGAGRVEQNRGGMRMLMPCARCGGSGRAPGSACKRCGGAGRVRGQDRIKVRIPAGIDDGGVLRLAGKGDAGEPGAPAGDAYLSVQVEAHPVFRREGRNLICDVEIGLAMAALGGKLTVPTLDGESAINLPAGTPSGQKFRLKGKGVPGSGKTSAGDLFAVIQIRPPKKLDKRSRELLQEFRERNE